MGLYCSLFRFVLSCLFIEMKVEDTDEFCIESEPENVNLVMEHDEHRNEEFRLKVKLEQLCFGMGNYFVL